MGKKNKLKYLMTSFALLSTVATVAVPSVSGMTTAHAANSDIKLDTSTPEAFIASIGPTAQKVAAKHDMYASVMIAQALIESGDGQSTLAQAPNYNLFGIKGEGPAGTVNMSTQEDNSNGSSYTTNAGFRKYNSFKESLEDNAEVISSNPIYAKAWRSNAKTYKDATQALQGTYATSTTYAQTLDNTIQQYKLTRYDSSKYVQSPNAGDNSSLEDLTNAELLKKYNIKPNYKTYKKVIYTPVLYKTTKTDSIWGIAQQYKVSPESLLAWNKDLKSASTTLPANSELQVGRTKHVKIIAYRNVKVHHYTKVTIKYGDSLWKIAHDNHTTIKNIEKLNHITSSTMLYSGNKLKVKDKVTIEKKVLTEKQKKAADKKALSKAKVYLAADLASSSSSSNSSDSDSGTTYTTNDESAAVKKVIALATKQIGKPYVWGAKGPNSFDCSGLMHYVFLNALGTDIGGWTGTQQNAGTKISVSDAKAGDLYFWESGGTTYHVALAIGNGKFIAAPRPGENVEVENINEFMPQYAVRIIQSNK